MGSQPFQLQSLPSILGSIPVCTSATTLGITFSDDLGEPSRAEQLQPLAQPQQDLWQGVQPPQPSPSPPQTQQQERRRRQHEQRQQQQPATRSPRAPEATTPPPAAEGNPSSGEPLEGAQSSHRGPAPEAAATKPHLQPNREADQAGRGGGGAPTRGSSCPAPAAQGSSLPAAERPHADT